MAKAGWFKITAYLIMLAATIYLIYNSRQTPNNYLPPQPTATEKKAPLPAPPDTKELHTPATPASASKQQLTMTFKPKAFSPSPQPDKASLSYRIKKDNKAIPITPGVKYIPGESVKIALPTKDENICINQDKIVWQKNF